MARTLKNPLAKVRIPRLPQVTDEPDSFEEMTLQEHLEEFRDRILKMVIAIVPAFIIGAIFAERILLYIVENANTDDAKLDIRSPTDPLTLYFKVALYVAISITLPFIVYQIIAFLAPGLTRKEKRILFSSLPFVTLLFVTGVSYGFFIAAPRALVFLSGFMDSVFSTTPDGQEVLSFFLVLMMGLGLSFQLPVIMFILAKIGIVSPQKMRQWRRYSYLVLLILSAIITPSTDPFNMAMVAVPLVILYEAGIIFSSVFAKTGLRTQNYVTDDVDDIDPVASAAEKADDV